MPRQDKPKGASTLNGRPLTCGLVDAMERYGNRRQRVEKLVSAWNQGVRETVEAEHGADDPRTARAQGVSVNSIAKRFGITRQTVWEKTR